ncbi:MAG: substrate-binding domain-containing protein [Rudaea sp.]
MFKVTISPQWQLHAANGVAVPERLIELLVGIHETGSLARACARAELSYRYAWGILSEAQKALGVTLVTSTRGSGATLTALGEKLVWADKRIAARLSPLLDTLGSEMEVEFERVYAPSEAILRIQASHGFAVELLHRELGRRLIATDMKYRSSQEVFASLTRGSCDLAGLHVPVGEFESVILRHYAKPLRSGNFRVIDLTLRWQGLMVAPGNPKKIRGLADLERAGIRFVNRQIDSGTRSLFDALLEKNGVEGHAIEGYDNGEFTHAAVAAYVASGMADAGFGVEPPARRFGLDFIPLVHERYFFLCPKNAFDGPGIRSVQTILGSTTFRKTVAALPGYDPRHCGRVQEMLEAFPSLKN